MSLIPYVNSLDFTEESLRRLRDCCIYDPLLNDAERCVVSNDIEALCERISEILDEYYDSDLDASVIVQSRREQT
jgi:hypothetical protein